MLCGFVWAIKGRQARGVKDAWGKRKRKRGFVKASVNRQLYNRIGRLILYFIWLDRRIPFPFVPLESRGNESWHCMSNTC